MSKPRGGQQNLQLGRERMGEAIPQMLVGGGVIAAELVVGQFVDIPDVVETIALGGGSGLAMVGLYNAVRGFSHRREARRWR